MSRAPVGEASFTEQMQAAWSHNYGLMTTSGYTAYALWQEHVLPELFSINTIALRVYPEDEYE